MEENRTTVNKVPVIELRHVDKHFGELHVLKDINLSVKKGEVVVVIGPLRFRQIDPVPDHQPPGDH